MKLKLEPQRLRELLEDFYILTKIRIVIFDSEFNHIIAYPEDDCEFCSLMKSNETAVARCDESDREGCVACRSDGRFHVYRCHAGLTEVVAPIKVNDIILGYIMIGQITDGTDREVLKNEVLDKCGCYGIKKDELSRAFDRLVFEDIEQIKAASKILESLACYLWITELISIDEGDLIYKISKHINTGLNTGHSVESICREFRISRSKLYELSHKYFGMSIAKYIRKKRIELAAKYLVENNCPVGEAAGKTGFDDYNYFSKMFKKETGYSPKEYKALKTKKSQ